MQTRRQKIAGLLNSSSEGERAAAQAALDRLEVTPPPPGSPEWCAAMIDHKRMVSECAVRIDDPRLSTADVSTIRRWTRFVGKPWEDGAEELRRIHQLLTKEEERCLALSSPT
jgi:hypothetical protein